MQATSVDFYMFDCLTKDSYVVPDRGLQIHNGTLDPDDLAPLKHATITDQEYNKMQVCHSVSVVPIFHGPVTVPVNFTLQLYLYLIPCYSTLLDGADRSSPLPVPHPLLLYTP
uniref:Uncharacterized protein n=1 Tax=Timema bartmani TaxID=61472 RepID=A0A7R9I1U9_9NEOP|nr:unnamed protein product [Timema bartmani]